MEHPEERFGLPVFIWQAENGTRRVSYCWSENCPGRRACRDCKNLYSRVTRVKHRDLAPEQKRRANCRALTHHLIRAGKLVVGPCEDAYFGECAGRVEPHHDDYSKPAEVRWKCREHHRQFHRLRALLRGSRYSPA